MMITIVMMTTADLRKGPEGTPLIFGKTIFAEGREAGRASKPPTTTLP